MTTNVDRDLHVDAARPTLHLPSGRVDDSLWIDNERQRASGSGFVRVDDSASERTIAEIRSASQADVDRAFRSARQAQPKWAALSVNERVRIVREATTILESANGQLAEVLISEVGTTRREVQKVQVGLGITALRVTAEHAFDALEPRTLHTSIVTREAAGVVAAITPWNYPIFQVALKVGPALVAGCSVVLKPPGVAPLTAFAMARAFADAGLPPGVLNIVCGPGSEIGEYLAGHPEADFVSFTGSVSAGRQVAAAAGRSGTRSALELGGKSAAIVLDDDLLEEALRATFASAVSNNGQTCAALSRLIVPQRLLARAEELSRELVSLERVGDPQLPTTTIGPMSNRGQRDTVLGYLADAKSDPRVRLISAGSIEGLERGWFAPPAVYTADDPRARIVQEEIFGPVLTIQPYQGDDEAIRLANDTPFGLIARVWTKDASKFNTAAQQLQVGGVIQSGRITAWDAPFGGVKDSGYGRERGPFGIEEYLVAKSIQPAL